MNYIVLCLFSLINTTPIFIFNIENAIINGSLTILQKLYNRDKINLNDSCTIDSSNINFENIVTIESFGNIVLNNIADYELPNTYYLLGLDENYFITKDIFSFEEKNNTAEKTVGNINGLNNNPLKFDSGKNTIFIASNDTFPLNINCQNLSLNNIYGKNMIFNSIINAYNTVLLGDISCDRFQVNNGSIFIKSPTTITTNTKDIEILKSKVESLSMSSIEQNNKLAKLDELDRKLSQFQSTLDSLVQDIRTWNKVKQQK